MDLTIDVESFIDNMTPMSKLLAVILFFIIVEIIYFVFVRTEKRHKGKNVLGWVVAYKTLSFVCTGIVSVFLILLLSVLPTILFLIGLFGVIALYFGLNYLVAKVFGKEETATDRKERLKEEDKKYKFKIGQKVKVIDAVRYSQEKYLGKTVTITDRDEKSFQNIYDTDVNVKFGEERLASIRKRK